LKHAHELRQAAFKLYASLGANDEDIRKKVSLWKMVAVRLRQLEVGLKGSARISTLPSPFFIVV